MAGYNDKDYYAILGVSEDASDDEIRRSFQKKARTLHPDVNKEPDAEERFKELSEAYAVISDPDKRKRYDMMRSGNPFAGGYSTPTGGSPYTGGYPGGYGYPGGAYTDQEDSFFGWGFPFGMGGFRRTTTTRSRAYNPREGGDFVYDLKLDEDAAAKGTKRGINYQHYVACEACSGSGSKAASAHTTCPTCSGSGFITLDMRDLLGMGAMRITCPECEGTGEVVAEPCEVCGGSGRTVAVDEIVVEIPAHSSDGTLVRVAGKGNAGTNGESAGDFVVRVSIPEQKLSRSASSGFYMLGAALLFVLMGLLSGRIASFSLVIALPLFFAIMSLSREQGLLSKKAGWWKNAGRAMMMGFVNIFPFAVFVLLMSTCSGRMWR